MKGSIGQEKANKERRTALLVYRENEDIPTSVFI
jgi:hypothetical protein